MPLLCKKITILVTQKVTEPVDEWVEKQEEECKQYPWYDPRGWLCWLVTVTVKVVSFVTKEVLVPMGQVVCSVVSGLIFLTLAPFAAAIDSVSQTFHFYETVRVWFIIRSKITFVSKEPTGVSDAYYYKFKCRCSDQSTETIVVTASNDDEAAQKAEEECAKACA